MRRFVVEVRAVVEVTVHDENVIDRCVNNEDGWRDSLYNLKTPESVAEHLAYNHLINGVEHINRQIEGWGDVDDDAATFRVPEVDCVGTELAHSSSAEAQP